MANMEEMKTLHILNGDSSLNQIKQTNIKGDTFVWRELLCEGETKFDLRSDEFWQTRIQFFNEYFDYFEKEKLIELKDQFFSLKISAYKEIVLWFEYDLFCQINLIALLSWLKQSNVDTKIYLICIGEHPNYRKLVGLGEITHIEFEQQYEHKIQLGKADLEFASKIWKIYCSNKIVGEK